MSEDKIAISLQNISKDFRLPHERADSVKSLFINPFRKRLRNSVETQHALKDIDFEVKQGEFFGVVGRNGSGKSTLLKIIAGIYQPTKGKVVVNGRLVPFIELGVGFNPELTGRENVYMNGALLGFSTKEIDHKYHAIVEFSELERFMDQRLKNYSSGMQVRLAFSVATILAESDVLLIDEVLAVGDADFQKKCFDYFKMLKKNKKTVIFVSHDMNSVRNYCDRAVLIDQSEVIATGSADEIAKEYTRLFLPNEYKQLKELEEKNNRDQKWGDGSVDIQNLKLGKKILHHDDKALTYSFTIKSHTDFDYPVLAGMLIKNDRGEAICGTNSDILKDQPKLIPKKGQEYHCEWSIPNIFNEGVYTIEPSVVTAESGEVCLWWDDAVSFQAKNEENTPYIAGPKITLVIKDK
jgi:ABC-2 type transport system ATP-binding protein